MLAAYGFPVTFLAAGAIGAVAWALVVRGVPTGAARAGFSLAQTRAAVAVVLCDPRIVITSIAQAAQFVLHGLITAFLPIYAVERAGLGAGEAGALFGAQMLTTIASRPLFGQLSDAVGRRWMIVAGLLTCALAVGVLPAATTFWQLLIIAFIYGAGLAVTTSSTAGQRDSSSTG